MAEQLTLAANEMVPQKVTTYYRVVRLLLDKAAQVIAVVVKGENGEVKSFEYTGTVAQNFLTALNKANLSTKSLEARILERLSQDGLLVGTVTGSPD